MLRRAALIRTDVNSSETSVLTRATRRNVLEDAILHSHRRENFKTYWYTHTVVNIVSIQYTVSCMSISRCRIMLWESIKLRGVMAQRVINCTEPVSLCFCCNIYETAALTTRHPSIRKCCHSISPTSGDRSVCIVRLRTKGNGDCFRLWNYNGESWIKYIYFSCQKRSYYSWYYNDDNNNLIQFNSLLFVCPVNSYKANYRQSTV
jgi:hypothetical protein